jgi:AcrR family transcriptional regulator
LQERGFKGTTIADIAEVAGIALGTIYPYFPSKDDVFRGMNERLTAIITDAPAVGEDDATLEHAVRSRIDNVFHACDKNRDLVRLVVLNTDLEHCRRDACARPKRSV